MSSSGVLLFNWYIWEGRSVPARLCHHWCRSGQYCLHCRLGKDQMNMWTLCPSLQRCWQCLTRSKAPFICPCSCFWLSVWAGDHFFWLAWWEWRFQLFFSPLPCCCWYVSKTFLRLVYLCLFTKGSNLFFFRTSFVGCPTSALRPSSVS